VLTRPQNCSQLPSFFALAFTFFSLFLCVAPCARGGGAFSCRCCGCKRDARSFCSLSLLLALAHTVISKTPRQIWRWPVFHTRVSYHPSNISTFLEANSASSARYPQHRKNTRAPSKREEEKMKNAAGAMLIPFCSLFLSNARL
jgi:hypothetical protein